MQIYLSYSFALIPLNFIVSNYFTEVTSSSATSSTWRGKRLHPDLVKLLPHFRTWP